MRKLALSGASSSYCVYSSASDWVEVVGRNTPSLEASGGPLAAAASETMTAARGSVDIQIFTQRPSFQTSALRPCRPGTGIRLCQGAGQERCRVGRAARRREGQLLSQARLDGLLQLLCRHPRRYARPAALAAGDAQPLGYALGDSEDVDTAHVATDVIRASAQFLQIARRHRRFGGRSGRCEYGGCDTQDDGDDLHGSS